MNGLLYNYGLLFNAGWYGPYSLGYLLSYQFVILLLVLYSRSWRLFVLMEAFVLSSTQDLVYFAVWNGGFPVGDWVWMPLCEVFGGYTLVTQLLLSCGFLGFGFAGVMVKKRFSVKWGDVGGGL